MGRASVCARAAARRGAAPACLSRNFSRDANNFSAKSALAAARRQVLLGSEDDER